MNLVCLILNLFIFQLTTEDCMVVQIKGARKFILKEKDEDRPKAMQTARK